MTGPFSLSEAGHESGINATRTVGCGVEQYPDRASGDNWSGREARLCGRQVAISNWSGRESSASLATGRDLHIGAAVKPGFAGDRSRSPIGAAVGAKRFAATGRDLQLERP